jgi:hypothetical protein
MCFLHMGLVYLYFDALFHLDMNASALNKQKVNKQIVLNGFKEMDLLGVTLNIYYGNSGFRVCFNYGIKFI